MEKAFVWIKLQYHQCHITATKLWYLQNPLCSSDYKTEMKLANTVVKVDTYDYHDTNELYICKGTYL